jgi:Bacterial Ig domain
MAGQCSRNAINDSMKQPGKHFSDSWPTGALVVTLICLFARPTFAQTKLRLSTIKPGTERVQLIYNGDFQFQGPLIGANYPSPTGWTGFGDVFANAGSNMVAYNNGVVYRAQVNSSASVGLLQQAVPLEPATAYVFSGYIWNMGDSTNHVNASLDLNDAPTDPQMTVSYTDLQAAQGYFVYRSFNTSSTGTNVIVRAFYDGFTGTGTSPTNYPVAAQWDNVAITKAVNFVAPQPSGSAATLRPQVRITSPANGGVLYASGGAATLAADATDLDGTVTNVQFFVGAAKVGESTSSPWTASWTNASYNSYVVTAVAADNTGATTVSASISVTVTGPPLPSTLTIKSTNGQVALSWTDGPVRSVQVATNLAPLIQWTNTTNSPQVTGFTASITLPVDVEQKFVRLVAGEPEVDATTMSNKLLMGYQGWFACPGDGSAGSQWIHWFGNQTPTATNATVDMWPDVSELDADELFATSMTYSNGAPAKLYSAYNAKTVLRHFKWMRDNRLDGVFLQRFPAAAGGSGFARLNKVANNVRAGADTYQRVFAMMYDISGQQENTLVSTLTNDWIYLVNVLQITNSARYLRHNGKPVVAIWGFGFTDRPGTPQQATEAINFFKSSGLTVMGGVPTSWRTLSGDSQTDPAWATVYRSFDIISPWSVGRYSTTNGADSFRVNFIVPDLADATANGRDYLPVIFPGFSWFNLYGGSLNQIPRNGGTFYWRQAYNARLSGCSMIYGAMFDEVDEGTAMFKLAPTAAEVPAQGSWVPLNIDGQNLPSDWYLRLAGEASRMLRGDIPLTNAIPIAP